MLIFFPFISAVKQEIKHLDVDLINHLSSILILDKGILNVV